MYRAKVDQFTKLKKDEGEETQVEGVEEIVQDEDDAEDEKELEFDEIADSMKREELKAEKKKRKKLMKDRKKIHDKTNLKMIIPGDAGPTDTSEDTLFSLKSVRDSTDLENLTEGSQMPNVDGEGIETTGKIRPKVVKYDKSNEILDSSGK